MASSQMIDQLLEKKKVLVAAHRGTYAGNIIQNTRWSVANALLHGADIAEIDLIRSTDGVFYGFHNGQESWLIDRKEDIRKMASAEIEQCVFRNAIMESSGQTPMRAVDILLPFRGKCLFNIDRTWFYWDETIAFLNSLDMDEQLILKSPVQRDYLEVLARLDCSFHYMPIVKTESDWEIVSRYRDSLPLIGAELVFDSLCSPLCSSHFLKELQKSGLHCWVNAITLNDSVILSGGVDDDKAIQDGFESAWGKLIDMGFDMIQTDFPALLSGFIAARTKFVS